MQTLYASVQGNARAKKWEGGVRECVWGEDMGDFWDSIGNVNEEISNKNLKNKKKKRKEGKYEHAHM